MIVAALGMTAATAQPIDHPFASPTTQPTLLGRRTVTVEAYGDASAPVDRYVIEFTVDSGPVGSDVSDTAAIEPVMTRVRDAIRSVGADAAALERPAHAPSTRASTQPDMRRATLVVAIRLTDEDEAAKVAEAIKPIELPFVADTISSPEKAGLRHLVVRSTSSRPEGSPQGLFTAATRNALAAARERATLIAAAADLKLGPVISIGPIRELNAFTGGVNVSADGKMIELRVAGTFVFELTE